jgi:hypothetical protein
MDIQPASPLAKMSTSLTTENLSNIFQRKLVIDKLNDGGPSVEIVSESSPSSPSTEHEGLSDTHSTDIEPWDDPPYIPTESEPAVQYNMMEMRRGRNGKGKQRAIFEELEPDAS